MKKFTVTLLAIAMVALGTMFAFGQTTATNTDATKTGKSFKEGKRGDRGKRGMKGKRGMRGKGHGGMMFKQLDLTDDQKAQMKAIREQSRESTKSLHEQMKANRLQLAQLTANGTFDEASVAAIAQQQGQIHAQIIVAKEKVKAQTFNILTAEQKAKVATLKAERQQKMQERKAKFAEKKAAKQAQE